MPPTEYFPEGTTIFPSITFGSDRAQAIGRLADGTRITFVRRPDDPDLTVEDLVWWQASGLVSANTGLQVPRYTVATLPPAGTEGRVAMTTDNDQFVMDTGIAWINIAGSVAGVVPISQGGTNATTAAQARINLGLGTAAVLNTPISTADGGTGANTSALSGVPSWNAGVVTLNDVLTATRLLFAAAGNLVSSSANLTYSGTTLSNAGLIHSTVSGIRFPDGTTQTTAAAGGITGSGTAGRVTLWTGASTLGDDADLTYSGSTLTNAGLIHSTVSGFRFPDGTTQTTASTLTGTGAAGRVGYWTGATALSNDIALTWDDINNRLGIGTASPTSPLTVVGLIESTASGFKFPDATIQTTAATGTVGGTGVDTRVAFWTGASTLSNDADLTWDTSTNRLTATNVLTKVQPVADITAFGASVGGSGATNRAAIQAAHDALPATGGIIFIPTGSYTIDTTTITITKAVTVRGTGMTSAAITSPIRITDIFNVTVVNATFWEDMAIAVLNSTITGTTANLSPIVTAIASTSGLLAGMAVIGAGIPAHTTILSVDSGTQITLSQNATASATVTLTIGMGVGAAIHINPTTATNFTGARFHNVYFFYPHVGIDFEAGSEWVIDSCRFDNSQRSSISISNPNSPDYGANAITDSVFSATALVANTASLPSNHVEFFSGGGLSIIGNKMGQADTAIALASTVGTSVFQITGNAIEDFLSTGIQMFDTSPGANDFVSITGNEIGVIPTATAGVLVGNSGHTVSICGNTFHFLLGAGVRSGVIATNGASNVLVSGNTFEGGGNTLGIRIDGTAAVAVGPNMFESIGTEIQGTPSKYTASSVDFRAAQDAIRLHPYGAVAGNTAEVRWFELLANGTSYVGFKAPDALAAAVMWTLPNADGSAGQVLSTNGAGVLSWGAGGGGGTIGGSIATGQVAFGSGANTIAGENDLFWETATNQLGIGGNTFIKGPGPWIDVKYFGATGDGVTDDTTFIQNALNFVPAQGATVYFPPGVYKITAGLTCGNPTRLLGAGALFDNSPATAKGTVITSALAITLITVASQESFAMESLSLSGGSVGVSLSGTGGRDTVASLFRNANFLACGVGLAVHSAVALVIDGCFFHNCTTNSITIENTNDVDRGGCYISNCAFYHTAGTVLSWTSMGGLFVHSNTFEGGGTATSAIDCNLSSGATGALHFTGNFIEFFTAYSIRVRNAGSQLSEVHVADNLFTGAKFAVSIEGPAVDSFGVHDNRILMNGITSAIGIKAIGCNLGNISGNTMQGDGSTTIGFVVDSTTIATTIENNTTTSVPTVVSGTPGTACTIVNRVTPSHGQVLIGNATTKQFTQGNITGGTGLSVTNGAGTIALANTGVTSITGTANQVIASASTGAVTLSLPQSIHTAATPQFSSLGLNVAAGASGTLSQVAGANGANMHVLRRTTDSGPTGTYLLMQNAASALVAQIDIQGRASLGALGVGTISPTTAGQVLIVSDLATNGAGNASQLRLSGATDSNKTLIFGINTTANNGFIHAYQFGGSSYTLMLQPTGTTGIQVGTPTGGDKGGGTANFAGDIYKNNSAYTNPDYVLEHAATGVILQFADREGASAYDGLWPLADVAAFTREHFTLPRIAQARARASSTLGLFEGGDAVLASLEEAYLYIFQLEARLAALEAERHA